MDIIKVGNKLEPNRRKWRGTCGSCDSEIEAIEGELTVHAEASSAADLTGDNPVYATGMCPKCKTSLVKFYPV